MRRQSLDRAVLAVMFTVAAASAHAQPPPPPPPPFAGTFEFVGAEMPRYAVVRGAPFSAEGVTTVTQTLGDGTRIDRRTTAKLYRDSEGRMRREQTVLGLNALNPSADAQPIVTISDPVAGVTYVLEPNTRTARRSRLSSFGRDRELEKLTEKLRDAGQALERQRAGEPPPPPPPPPPPGERGGRGGPGARGRANMANVANWPEPLGTKAIEGVAANGTRRTETIPAGRIGNDRPIVVTDERWESPELKMVVLSQHHDPRTGDVEYRLTNINRAEPPQNLFAVPADYDVVDAPPPPPPPAPRQ